MNEIKGVTGLIAIGKDENLLDFTAPLSRHPNAASRALHRTRRHTTCCAIRIDALKSADENSGLNEPQKVLL